MPLYDVNDMVESFADRRTFDRWGIGTAAQYVKAIRDESPRDDVKRLGDDDKWNREIADASQRLTYCDVGMEVDSKSINDGAGISSGAILEYDAVLSSRRKDRDGDILETSGLAIDTKMPLLWQHLQLQPIGKHVAVLSQTEDLVTCKFAIADTALGRDAATLTRFGALRKSHGFKPIAGEVEPLEIVRKSNGEPMLNDKGQPIVRGWHVKKANVFEGSLVSIPANADGNVLRMYEKQFDGLATAFSRDLLADPLVKHWAKGIYDKRPVTVSGIDLAVKSGGREITWNPTAGRWQDVETKRFISAREVTESDHMPTKAASMKCPHCGTANDMSGVPDGMDLTKRMCSSCGKPLGTEKGVGDVDTKAGRMISAANEERLRKAVEAINAILNDAGLNDDDMDKAAKKVAAGLAGDVVLSGGGKSIVETLAAKTLGGLSTKSIWDDSYGDELPGSYEAISSQLSKQAVPYLKASGAVDVSLDGYCRTLATFPTEAIVCCRVSGGGDYKTRCFRMSYAVDADGMAKFNGTPTEVEVKPTIIEKSLAVTTTPPDVTPKSLVSLAREVAARIVTADGTGGEVSAALDTITKAHATKKQMEEGFDFDSLFTK